MHRWALLVGLGSLIACGGGKAAEAPPPVVATTGAIAGQVIEVSGEVTATRAGAPRRLEVGASVHDDDAIATGAGGRIAIKLARNDVTWRMGPNMNQVVAQSAAWGAPRASGDVAQISGDRSAAAGRNAEREAADTAASQTAAPAAAAPMPAAAATAAADVPMDRGADPVARRGQRSGAKGAPPSEALAVLDDDADSFGAAGLGLTGTGSGGGGAGDGIIGLGGGGGIGRGSSAGAGGGSIGLGTRETKDVAPRALRAAADAPPNVAPPPPPPPDPTPPADPPPADKIDRETGTPNAKTIAPRVAPKPAPPPTVALVAGALSVSGPRTADAIARGLAPVHVGLTRCAVASDEVAARLTVSFAIAADGKPGAATWSGGSAAFKACASGAIAALRFAPATAASRVRSTIVISR